MSTLFEASHNASRVALRDGLIKQSKYSRSSRKRPPREFEKVVVTRAGRSQEYALVSDPMVKHSLIIHENKKRTNRLMSVFISDIDTAKLYVQFYRSK